MSDEAPVLDALSGMTAEDIQDVMIAVVPVVGAPRLMAADGPILRALGLQAVEGV